MMINNTFELQLKCESTIELRKKLDGKISLSENISKHC